MMTRSFDRWIVCSVLCVLLLFGSWVDRAMAQERPSFLAELSGGWIGFPDDGLVNETLVGGALGWYVWPRLAMGPEVGVLQGNNHRHVLLTGRLTVDLAKVGRTVVPYVVVAGGLSQTHYQHPDASVTTRDGVFTAGAGVRAAVGRRVNVGLEARAGWESHVRVTGLVGVKLRTSETTR